MHAKKVDEQIYACLFCVQQRQTTHPNDATVFFSQRQLFAHLARHPRPLPHVPGLTVIQGEGHVPVNLRLISNYDLHFTEPPRISPLAHMMRDLTALPTATSVQTSQLNSTTRMIFAAGARIVGVEFPERYQGEWCLGWADHEHGLIAPAALHVDPPSESGVRNKGSSSMAAVARWKSASPTKDGDWLVFGKGEALTNIGWSHEDHWCWRGTNAKGRSGLILRSHVEPGTLKEDASRPDGGSVTSAERKAGLLARMSMRHRSSSGGARVGKPSPRASID